MNHRAAIILTCSTFCQALVEVEIKEVDITFQAGEAVAGRSFGVYGFGIYLVPGLSRITWVFCTSARRLLRERIIDDTSSYEALHLHFHILRRLPNALPSVSLSRLERRPSSHDCVLVYCRIL